MSLCQIRKAERALTRRKIDHQCAREKGIQDNDKDSANGTTGLIIEAIQWARLDKDYLGVNQDKTVEPNNGLVKTVAIE